VYIDAPERGLLTTMFGIKGIYLDYRLRNRISTKRNLVRRGILHHDDTMCVTGCGSVETTDRLFFTCDIFSVWALVL